MKFGQMIFGLVLVLAMGLTATAAETLSQEKCPVGGCPVQATTSGDCCGRSGFMGRGPVRRFVRNVRPVRRGVGLLFRRGCRGCR